MLRIRWGNLALLLVLAVTVLAGTAGAAQPAEEPKNGSAAFAPPTVWHEEPWSIADTANFRVCVVGKDTDVAALALRCEVIRAQLSRRWLGKLDAQVAWTPRCHVVVHATADAYCTAAQAPPETAGTSYIRFARDGKTVDVRRIDLRGDHPDRFTDALAHEMTHLVIRVRFIGRLAPRWADEGMAVLADSPSKQALHARDLERALTNQDAFRVADLLSLDGYPDGRWDTFYGQSASLTGYLVERGTHEQFLRFVVAAQERGYDAALREAYQIADAGQLEREWLAVVRGDPDRGHVASAE